MPRALLLGSAALLAGACFSDLQGTRCDGNGDCFDGEVCVSGTCIPTISTGSGDPELDVEVRVASASEPGRWRWDAVATHNGGSCNCGFPGDRACVFPVDPSVDQTFCVFLAGHHPCRKTVPAGLQQRTLLVEFVLRRCPEDQECPDIPSCGCEEAEECVQ